MMSLIVKNLPFSTFIVAAVASILLSSCSQMQKTANNLTDRFGTNGTVSSETSDHVKMDPAKVDEAVKRLFERVETDGYAIGEAVARLVGRKQITYEQFLDLHKKLYSGEGKFEDIVFLGSICSVNNTVCDELILNLVNEENPADFLQMARLVFMETSTPRASLADSGPVKIQHLGRDYKLPIPKNFCHANNTEAGQEIFELLDRLRLENKMLPMHYLVFAPCDGSDQPIGYVALSNVKETKMKDQIVFNEYAKRFMKSPFAKNMYNDLLTEQVELNDEFFGTKISKFNNAEPIIVSENEHALINVRRIAYEMNGLSDVEVQFNASVVLPTTQVYYYIIYSFDGRLKELDAGNTIEALNEVAKTLRALN